MRVLLASGNRKKAAEMAAILGDVPGARFEVLTLADFPGLASRAASATTRSSCSPTGG